MLYKTALTILLSTATLHTSSAMDTGSANVVTETRNVPAFSSIALNGIGTVRIHQGPYAVRVKMEKNLIDRYETEVKNGKLNIGFRCSFNLAFLRDIKNLKTCEVDIAMPELDRIELNGDGKISVDTFSYKTVRVDITGAGAISLTGAATELQVRCTGAGNVNARDLIAETGRISLTGAGTVEVRVEKQLDASITGAGKLIYSGNPHITRRISGAGSILRADS